jgi:hypothetical protein
MYVLYMNKCYDLAVHMYVLTNRDVEGLKGFALRKHLFLYVLHCVKLKLVKRKFFKVVINGRNFDPGF